jgi:hypothetical protein
VACLVRNPIAAGNRIPEGNSSRLPNNLVQHGQGRGQGQVVGGQQAVGACEACEADPSEDLPVRQALRSEAGIVDRCH